MPFSTDFVPSLRAPRRRLTRYLLALAIVGLATLLRFVTDPLLHDQMPYFMYVGAVVLSTWFAGRAGGVLAVVVSMFAGNYFFADPRYELMIVPRDAVEMSVSAAFTLCLVIVVGRWRRAEEELRGLHEQAAARAEELQVILDTVPAAVFVTRRADGSRMEGNRFTEEYLRLPTGSNVSKTAPPSDRPATFRPFKDGREIPGEQLPVQLAIARGLGVRDYEFDLVYEDGSRRTLFGNAMPLKDEAGNTRGAVGAFLDVTERKRLEVRLQEQTAALEHANRVKDEFLATLSHELRTPLNAMLGWSDMLLRPGLDEATRRKAIESIHRNARAQAALLSDILDVSRIVSGKLRLDMRPVDLGDVLKAACESIQPSAEARGIEIRTTAEDRPILVGDPDRLQQVLWNLLSNGVKFSERGGCIEVDLRRVGSSLRIVVKDNGAGIPPDHLPHIFERFRQADSSTTRVRSGLGLGLAIVRHLVELHGGTVTAESAGEGQGATFTVMLPAPAADQPDAEGEPLVTEAQQGQFAPRCLDGLRVVAVDDQEEARALIKAVLERHGARVTVCASAAEAETETARSRPDVLVADIGMPQVDGYELIRRIRALPDGKGLALPAVAVTAYGGEHDRAKVLAAGYWEYLSKPIMPDALVSVVAGLAGRT